MTDTMGNLLAVKVHRANLHDTKSAIFPAILYPTSDLCRCKTFVANVVERTLAWLAKDFEKTISSQEAMIKISHIHTLLKRL